MAEDDDKKEETAEATATEEATTTDADATAALAAAEETKEEEETPTPAAPAPQRTPKRTALEVAAMYKDNIAGKIFLITGAYSGIGVETTKAILTEGGQVIVGGRNEQGVTDFVAKMKEEFPDSSEKIDGSVIDLADLESVKTFAEYVNDKYARIDCLICNAGVMACPAGATKQGHEMQMGTNVIGHFLLAKLLIDMTKRQVWLSSTGHTLLGAPRINIEYYKNFTMEDTSTYNEWSSYQQSKLGDILVAKEFHKRYPDVEAASCHPGLIQTNLGRHQGFWSNMKFAFTKMPGLMVQEGRLTPMKNPQQGASTSMTVAALPSDELENGAYYKDCVVQEVAESAKNEEDAAALFDYCEEVTAEFQKTEKHPRRVSC